MQMKKEESQLILDATRLQREIHARGFSSVKDFADSVGVHRNTVGNYLSGKTALPGALARIGPISSCPARRAISVAERIRS